MRIVVGLQKNVPIALCNPYMLYFATHQQSVHFAQML
jgi:hypothetical protein